MTGCEIYSTNGKLLDVANRRLFSLVGTDIALALGLFRKEIGYKIINEVARQTTGSDPWFSTFHGNIWPKSLETLIENALKEEKEFQSYQSLSSYLALHRQSCGHGWLQRQIENFSEIIFRTLGPKNTVDNLIANSQVKEPDSIIETSLNSSPRGKLTLSTVIGVHPRWLNGRIMTALENQNHPVIEIVLQHPSQLENLAANEAKRIKEIKKKIVKYEPSSGFSDIPELMWLRHIRLGYMTWLYVLAAKKSYELIDIKYIENELLTTRGSFVTEEGDPIPKQVLCQQAIPYEDTLGTSTFSAQSEEFRKMIYDEFLRCGHHAKVDESGIQDVLDYYSRQEEVILSDIRNNKELLKELKIDPSGKVSVLSEKSNILSNLIQSTPPRDNKEKKEWLDGICLQVSKSQTALTDELNHLKSRH